ncbi:hypothetical protein [Glutamicibacter sp.]|jgi:hypothetical protein|uniref:hypothetical protein n=1 Tax=Glutamicibacter sp. TaxID=1931995 RepID=UPI002B491EC2|nr:hypothetical protein [Glutamicibacter sp.]HJX76821.1 hypothetical protein [Glutamicibacter sp.]
MAHYEVKHRSLLTLLLILPSLIVLGTRLLLGTSLPAITATHWSGSANPDGFTDTRVFVTVCISLAIGGAVLGFISFALSRKPVLHSLLLFVGGLAGWTSAGLFVSCAVPSALAGDPTQALLNGGFTILSIVASLVGLLPVWISGVYQQHVKESQAKRRRRVTQAQGQDASVPTANAAAVTSAQGFNQTASVSWWFWLLGLFPLVMGILMLTVLKGDDESETLIMLISGPLFVLVLTPLVLGLCKIRVRITEDQVRVSSAIFAFPLRTISVNQIKEVRSEEISPMEWSGWGWRFFPGGSAVVLHRGEGLSFDLKDGKRFAVTISDSQRAAAILHSKMTRV